MRLPRRALSAPLVLLEQRWLPVLAPHLPLPVPVPVRAGQPSAALDYPWHWSVCPWLPGSPAASTPFADPLHAARKLGELQEIGSASCRERVCQAVLLPVVSLSYN